MAQKIAIELEFDSTGAVKNIDQVNKGIQEVNKASKDTPKELNRIQKGLKKVGSAGKAVAKGGLKAVGGAIKGIGKAYMAAGIGLIVAGFGFLFNAFKENQKVIDQFNIVMDVLASIGKQVSDVIISVYKNVSSATENFDALGKVVKGLLTLAITPLKLGFQAIKGALLGAQLAWEQSWLGGNDPQRIEELKAELNEVKESVIEIGTDAVDAGKSIVNNFSEAIAEAGSIATQVVDGVKKISIEAALETATTNVELKKSADRARIANQGLIEKYDRQAEQQRQIRDNEFKTIAQRTEANEILKEKLEEQKLLMLENVAAIQASAQAQFDLTGKEEDYLAVLEAKNEVKAVEAQIEGFMSEQDSNRNALLKEKIELEQAQKDGLRERKVIEDEFTASQIENEYARLLAEKDIIAQEKELETIRLTEKRDLYQEGTQAYIDANNELLAFQIENGNKQTENEKKLAVAKTQIMTNALGNLASIVGKSSKFGKAIAIVQAVRDTFAGANKALASAAPPFNFIAAAAVTAAGIANVKSILSTKDPQPPAGLGASGGGSVPTPAIPTPPSFNVVGQGETSQLADAIGGQTQTPLKAYVVSNDVTTAQGLERNIVEGATI
jgi:hypothetical protein